MTVHVCFSYICMLVDNFELFRELLEENPLFGWGPWEYYSIQIIRRGKDHPDLPSANKTFYSFYLEKPGDLMKYREEIITLSEMTGSRAYIYLNRRSMEKSLIATISAMAERLMDQDYKKPWKIFNSASASMKAQTRYWVLDIDEPEDLENLDKIKEKVRSCDPGKDVITEIPTRTGKHIITHPFNVVQFKEEYPGIDIKKTANPTLLYCNL